MYTRYDVVALCMPVIDLIISNKLRYNYTMVLAYLIELLLMIDDNDWMVYMVYMV